MADYTARMYHLNPAPGTRATDQERSRMAENLKLARLYLLLLAIFTVGRWLLGTFGVPYERSHYLFSIVIMTAGSPSVMPPLYMK